MTQTEIIVACLLVFSILDRTLKLEVPRRSLLDTPKEVQCVAAASRIEFGLKILELLQDNLLLFGIEVIESDSKASRTLSEEI